MNGSLPPEQVLAAVIIFTSATVSSYSSQADGFANAEAA
jgi:hypothetical protein